MPPQSDTTFTVLVVLRGGSRAVTRLLVHCHSRGWSPDSVRSTSDGALSEVLMRLRVPIGPRSTDARVQAQLARLIDVQQIVVDVADGLPDGVAFAAVRRKAPWLTTAA